jgi:Domain of unknown function (DUF4203)
VLPASFQLPAAVLLLVGGLVSCFAGYRVFRVVLGFFGFVFGALATSALMGTEQTWWTILAVIGGGITGALIMIAAYFVGVALIGAGVGAGAANLIWAGLGHEPGLLAVILLAVVGALAALALQRYVIIVSSAFGGAETAVVGVAALLGHPAAAEAATRGVYRIYPLDPLPQTKWDLFSWLALGTIGVLVQLGFTANSKARKKKR